MKTEINISKVWPILALVLALAGTKLEAKELSELGSLRLQLPNDPAIRLAIKNMPEWEEDESTLSEKESEGSVKTSILSGIQDNRELQLAGLEAEKSAGKEGKNIDIKDIVKDLEKSKFIKNIKETARDVSEELARHDLSLKRGGLAYELEGGDENTSLNISPKEKGSISLEYNKEEDGEDLLKELKLGYSGKEGPSIYGGFEKKF